MFEKVINNTEELNAVARHLRQIKEFKELRNLAAEWMISKQDVEDYISGKRYFLAEVKIEEKEYTKAEDKLREEMWLLKDKQFTDIIGWHLIKECGSSEKLGEQVLQNHKTLLKCLNFVMEKAHGLATEQYEEKHPGEVPQEPIGMAVKGENVFQWAKEYYALDDLDTEKQKKEEAKKKLREEQAAEEKRKTIATKTNAKRNGNTNNAPVTEKKKPEEEQLSLFNFMDSRDEKESKNESL